MAVLLRTHPSPSLLLLLSFHHHNFQPLSTNHFPNVMYVEDVNTPLVHSHPLCMTLLELVGVHLHISPSNHYINGWSAWPYRLSTSNTINIEYELMRVHTQKMCGSFFFVEKKQKFSGNNERDQLKMNIERDRRQRASTSHVHKRRISSIFVLIRIRIRLDSIYLYPISYFIFIDFLPRIG